ncbi:MAG: hypothetical protein M3128_01510 [Verrucomicrobiota bacterium]|nr:hypothetical protein [Verrucomicrobiota bacterium]
MTPHVLWQHLSDPEYLHVLLNPLPVYGLSMGVLGLLISLISRSRSARLAALAIVFVSAISAWPVYHYGQAGYDRVLSMSDDQGGKWLEEHMRRAEKLIGVFYIVAGLAAATAAAEWKLRKAAVPLAILTAVLASANLGVGGYIGYAGGHVRHKEFRFEPAPDPEEAEHHHHDGQSDEHTKVETSKPMDHGAMPGMDMSKNAEAKEQPMQHDAAAQPAAPTDEQLEASRMQLEASRLQLEASRKQLEATEAAKNETSPAPATSPTPHAEDGHHHEHKPEPTP